MVIYQKVTPCQTSQVKVPGKLYLAGEYAILTPRQAAILMAVDQYLQVAISPAWSSTITLVNRQDDFPDLELSWDIESLTIENTNELDSLKEAEKNWTYVIQAIHTAGQFIQQEGILFQPFQLEITSQLTDASGLKYGLGSSGAVTVGTLKAVLRYHGINLAHQDLYKLAVLSLIALGSKGSFGDLAANIYGGWVYYQAPNHSWLNQLLESENNLHSILSCKWPGLVIKNIDVPNDLQILVGWTGNPSGTENLVHQLQKGVENQEDDYSFFLDQARPCVDALKKGLEKEQSSLILQAIHDYRHLLIDLSLAYEIPIETPLLTRLVDLAMVHGFAAKSSGAGGGDCGIALGFHSDKADLIRNEWLENDIRPLKLAPAPRQENFNN